LTIESGVTVNLNSYYLQLNGSLQAIGSTNDPINFQGTNSAYSSEIRFVKSNWNQPATPTSTIENAIINISLIRTYNETIKLNNATIFGSVTLNSWHSVITKNVFKSNSNFAIIASGAPIIWNNTFQCQSKSSGIQVSYDDYGMPMIVGNVIIGQGYQDGFGIWGGGAYISDNIISGWSNAIRLTDNSEIWNNWIFNNTIGITGEWEISRIIRNNTIENNIIGINVPLASSLINGNNFLNNQQ
jgi:hypothetical protein